MQMVGCVDIWALSHLRQQFSAKKIFPTPPAGQNSLLHIDVFHIQHTKMLSPLHVVGI